MCILVLFYNLVISVFILAGLGIAVFLLSKLTPRFSIPLNILFLYVWLVFFYPFYLILSFFLSLPMIVMS
jgi:hypothetical protein